MRDCFKKTYAIEGLGGFWKGIGPTLLRAMPVSAGTFLTYVCPLLCSLMMLVFLGLQLTPLPSVELAMQALG